MPALETPLRRTLEKKVIQARDTAEDAARTALDRLIGDTAHAPAYLNADEVTLREAVRAKERQLGGREALIRECAYEHWHAMLFARFLEASDLLMHPELGVAVTMDDLTELAEEEGDAGAYATAARYAAHMLPGIFRPTDPLLRVTFAPEARQTLERLLDEIPKPAYTADDALGWVYQFWQTEQKNRVNKSGRKIAGADISPVTQLFTEHYMVQFMLHNTIGAWWTARHPDQPLPTEKSYLRLNDDGTPAAGTFPGWPATVKELKVIDPSCGSGHFLVAAFALLRRLRVLEEGLSETEAADAVLRDNLHGLELDPRCTQLAAFNLTMEAWKVGGYRPLPPLNVACSGLNIGASVEDWYDLASGTQKVVLDALHTQFRQATDLGSLINPQKGSRNLPLYAGTSTGSLDDLLNTLLKQETAIDPAAAVTGETLQGVVRAAKLLNDTYHLAITNVPYLGRGNQGDTLKTFIEEHHAAAKADLATAFVERARDFTKPGGTYSLVTPQNWLFLGSYKKLREILLKEQQWDWVTRLGTGAFETITGEVVNVSLVTLTNKKPADTHEMLGIDASEGKGPEAKDAALREKPPVKLGQEGQRGNPNHVISLEEIQNLPLLEKYAYSSQGISPGDSTRFTRGFWELNIIEPTWKKLQSTPNGLNIFSGKSSVIFNPLLIDTSLVQGFRLVGKDYWESNGIAVGKIGNLPVSIFLPSVFDANCPVIIPKEIDYLPSIWCFMNSASYSTAARQLDQKLDIAVSALLKVPFDLPYWQKVAAEKYPNGLPEPYSNDPTQWLFKGTVTGTAEPLHVAMARLLGYAWPDQVADTITPDADGIVPLPALMGERAAHERLLDALAGEFGAAWTPAKLAELLAQVGADSLEGWLRDKFFEGHSKLFHHRPFLWHVWDGRKDGFSAVVNYHTLDRARLEKLTYTYLGAWIDRQRGSDEKGADLRLAAAVELQRKLEAILTGEPPYDIYVRWKALGEQPRGWNPDLNDGVRLNIRPFIEAGVLRAKVNVKWTKDRGSDPGKVDFQKVHGRDPETDLERHESNERHNDLHFTLAEKAGAN
ncbi:N-6 DNA methylase [Deinococcus sp. RIT780]|uniref:Eco57I restriction-modification methylase domain-containing protein n=1 Tax=Deinococcus sp. RIT780 TaxID=2870472 RepID=UPI001C8A93C3|nr:N-6 DNA methylase [Deinococcus sp. RIT780]MBX8463532.1 N-6 DNA methylase [Deinococcus sp. RIT780]